MFQKVPNRKVVFALPGGLTTVREHLKKKSCKNLKNLLIIAGLTPFLFTKPATAQFRTEVPQTVTSAEAAQNITDEATQKRIDELITQLGHHRPTVRNSATDALSKIGQPAIQPLIDAMYDKNYRVRVAAADALRKIGQPAVQFLIKALEDENDSIRISAADALGKIGQPAVQSLIKALESENGSVRLSAVKTLGKIGDPQAVQALIKNLNDRDNSIRVYTAEALGIIGSPQAVQSLIKALNDKNSRVRISVVEALGKIGDAQAVQSLIEALQDEDVSVRVNAANALGKVSDPRAVQSLIKALSDRNTRVRKAAARALDKIDDPRAEKALRKRALVGKAKKVLLFMVKLLVIFFLVFLLVAVLMRFLKPRIIRSLQYIRYNTVTGRRAIWATLVYLALVFGNAICPLYFYYFGVGLSLANALFGLLALLGLLWLSIATGGFFVLVIEYNLGLGMYHLLSLFYSSVFFLPLFWYLFFKKRNAKITCALVQVVFIICHAVALYILNTRLNLLDRMSEILRL